MLDPEKEIAEDVAAGGVAHELDLWRERTGEEFPDAIDQNVRDGDPRMHALDAVAWSRWKGPKSLFPTVQYPVLLVAGEGEDPTRQTERSVALLPQARLVRLPGVGHLLAFARSELTLPVLRPFFSSTLNPG